MPSMVLSAVYTAGSRFDQSQTDFSFAHVGGDSCAAAAVVSGVVFKTSITEANAGAIVECCMQKLRVDMMCRHIDMLAS